MIMETTEAPKPAQTLVERVIADFTECLDALSVKSSEELERNLVAKHARTLELWSLKVEESDETIMPESLTGIASIFNQLLSELELICVTRGIPDFTNKFCSLAQIMVAFIAPGATLFPATNYLDSYTAVARACIFRMVEILNGLIFVLAVLQKNPDTATLPAIARLNGVDLKQFKYLFVPTDLILSGTRLLLPQNRMLAFSVPTRLISSVSRRRKMPVSSSDVTYINDLHTIIRSEKLEPYQSMAVESELVRMLNRNIFRVQLGASAAPSLNNYYRIYEAMNSLLDEARVDRQHVWPFSFLPHARTMINVMGDELVLPDIFPRLAASKSHAKETQQVIQAFNSRGGTPIGSIADDVFQPFHVATQHRQNKAPIPIENLRNWPLTFLWHCRTYPRAYEIDIDWVSLAKEVVTGVLFHSKRAMIFDYFQSSAARLQARAFFTVMERLMKDIPDGTAKADDIAYLRKYPRMLVNIDVLQMLVICLQLLALLAFAEIFDRIENTDLPTTWKYNTVLARLLEHFERLIMANPRAMPPDLLVYANVAPLQKTIFRSISVGPGSAYSSIPKTLYAQFIEVAAMYKVVKETRTIV